MFNIRERIASQWAVARKHLVLVLGCLAVLWAVFFVQLALPAEWLNLRNWGIRPRSVSGFFYIAAAPFLHVEFRRLLSLTLPLLVVGWLLSMADRRLLLRVCLISALTSGGGVWLFGQDEIVHPGASGVLTGLMGFLVTRGWIARHLFWTLVALGVGLFYFVELLLLPFSSGVSWAAHLWGFAGGSALAWWRYRAAAAGGIPGPVEARRR